MKKNKFTSQRMIISNHKRWYGLTATPFIEISCLGISVLSNKDAADSETVFIRVSKFQVNIIRQPIFTL